MATWSPVGPVAIAICSPGIDMIAAKEPGGRTPDHAGLFAAPAVAPDDREVAEEGHQ